MTPGRAGCCEGGLLLVEAQVEPDLFGLVWWSTSGRSRSSEDSLLLLLGIVISSDGSSCVDGPPMAFGATSWDAFFGGLFVCSKSLFGARRKWFGVGGGGIVEAEGSFIFTGGGGRNGSVKAKTQLGFWTLPGLYRRLFIEVEVRCVWSCVYFVVAAIVRC